ncbi:TPA: Arm DNA-binding domain-containing protein [Klebsiella michiganensis]
MALSDVKVRTAKPEEKAYKLTDGDGMVLLVHPALMIKWRYLLCNSDHEGIEE